VEFTINNGDAQRVYQAILVVDKMLPVITPNSPSEPYEINDETMSVEISYALTKSAMVAVVINDSKKKRVKTIKTATRLLGGESYHFEWDGTNDSGNPVDDGIYTVVFTGVDILGIKALQKTVTVRVERAAPTFTLTPTSIKPSATGATIQYTLSEVATVSSNFEIVKVDENGDEVAQPQLVISGAVGIKKAGSNKFTIKGALTVGTYKIKMIAVDAEGKSSSSEKLTLFVDNTSPTVSNLSVSDVTGNSGSTIAYVLDEHAKVTITIRVSSATGKVVHTVLNNVNQSANAEPITVPWNGKNTKGQVLPSSNGTTIRYFIVVNAMDLAGNVSAVASEEIQISA
jgi:hypothetical protein